MKSLVVYYSFSGNTRSLAEDIALITDADICELIPEITYTFSYNTAVKELRHEIETGHCPKLTVETFDVSDYELIFIGSPNWLKSFAPPIRTFLSILDLDSKIIVPFCTHGGGGFGKMIDDYRSILANSHILYGPALEPGYDFNDLKNLLDEVYKEIGE